MTDTAHTPTKNQDFRADPAFEATRALLRAAQRIAVMSGAGMSAESGVPTFRDAQTGLWSNCRPEDFPEILGDRIKAVHLKNFAESDSAGGLHGFGDDLFAGVVDFKKLFAAFAKIGYAGPYTVEMIPFSRLPDLVMPDAALAEKMVAQIKELKKYF